MDSCRLLIVIGLIKYISSIPVSPFGTPQKICFQGTAKPYLVNGFPGTPYVVQPFTETFKNPTEAQSSGTSCRADGHCLKTFEMDVKETQKRTFDNTIPSCKVSSFLVLGG